jgi:hypothetical protein
MVSVLVIVYECSTCSDGATAKLVRQVPHKRIDARHPDSDTSGALQIEAAGSCDFFRITGYTDSDASGKHPCPDRTSTFLRTALSELLRTTLSLYSHTISAEQFR